MAGLLGLAVEELDALAARNKGITGICLITPDGQLINASRGPLAEELGRTVPAGADGPPLPGVAQYLRPFNTLQPTVTLTALGQRLQVFHQSADAVHAVGPRRRTGLALCLLPQGVAAVTYDRSLYPPLAVNAIERCAAAVRARCAAA